LPTLRDTRPSEVIKRAYELNEGQGKRVEFASHALRSNLHILKNFGCLDEEGLAKLKKGHAPVIRVGRYAEKVVHIDHLIPKSICPELENKIYNLKCVPSTVNLSKGAAFFQVEGRWATRLHEAGLLSDEGIKRRWRAGRQAGSGRRTES